MSIIAEERMRPIEVKRIGDKISNMLYGTLFTNCFARGNSSFEEQSDDVIDIIFQGLLTGKERAETGGKAW